MPPPSTTLASRSSSGQTHLDPTLQPDINGRQASGPDILVTLSITRDTTTYTTVIVLGGTGGAAAPSTTDLQSASATTTVSSSSPTTAAPVAHKSTGTPSSVIIGAVLGTIFGTILCLILIWLCCYSPYRLNFPFYNDGGTASGSWESDSRKSSRPRRSRRSSYVSEEIIIVPRPRASGGRVVVEERKEHLAQRAERERIYDRPIRHAPPGGGVGAAPQGSRPFQERDLRPAGRRL